MFETTNQANMRSVPELEITFRIGFELWVFFRTLHDMTFWLEQSNMDLMIC